MSTSSLAQYLPKSYTIIKKVINIKINRYVDLGAGSCHITELIAKLFKPQTTYAVDIDDEALTLCRNKGFKTLKADLNSEDISSQIGVETVDLISAFEIMEHLYNPDNLLENSYKLLRPGGFLLLSTPNLASWKNRIRLLMGFQPFHYDLSFKYKLGGFKVRPQSNRLGDHIRVYTYRAIKQHLEIYGFKPIKILGFPIPVICSGGCYGLDKILNFLDEKIFSKIPSLATDILIIAKKHKD